MLLYLFITCVPFFLFLKSLSINPLPPWASEMRLLSPWFRKDLSFFTKSQLTKKSYKKKNNSFSSVFLCKNMSLKRKTSLSSKVENVEEFGEMSFLDLPELVLDCVLERLPPDALCSMAGVCTFMRERCMSDRLWEKHMKQKWGSVIGQTAYREWQWYIASKTDLGNLKQGKQRGLMRILSLGWPFSWIIRSKVDDVNSKQRSPLPVDSIMAWYLALETGKFYFPAQVYNREVYICRYVYTHLSPYLKTKKKLFSCGLLHLMLSSSPRLLQVSEFALVFHLKSEVSALFIDFYCSFYMFFAEWACGVHVVML